MYASIATLICGGVGGYLYNINKFLPYYAGIFLQIIGLFFVSKVTFYPSNNERDKDKVPNTFALLKKTIRTIPTFEIKLLIPIFPLFIIQLTIQPLFHYWQPLFYEIDQQVSGKLLGCIFASYTSCSILLNFVFSKLSCNSFFRSNNCIFIMLILSTIFYFISSISQNIGVTFISFSILQGLLFATMTCISAIMNRQIENESRPITLKMISLFSRIGMLISFGFIQLLSGITVHNLYFLSASILGTAIVFVKFIDLTSWRHHSNSKVEFENIA